MAIEFSVPDFVNDNDAETIQAQMMENLPADIDNLPAGFPYDFTMPTAMVKSELVQFHLVNTLKLMFPMWAYGEWLDLHAKAAGLTRRSAGYAAGYLTINGKVGTRIPKGSVFATMATDTAPSALFKAVELNTVDESGIVKIKVEAVESGIYSNVNPDTVVLMSKPISGITSITNEDYLTGGTETEDDESLRARINEVNQTEGNSFAGNPSDYIRWAKEVTGVGSALVEAEWDGPGTVKLIIIDSNGQPANETILENVYHYIVSPLTPLERKAPIGATVTVVAPVALPICYKCSIELDKSYAVDKIKAGYTAALETYYAQAKEEGMIKYSNTMALLTLLPGVNDVMEFSVNDHKVNVAIAQDEYPETTDIVIDVI